MTREKIVSLAEDVGFDIEPADDYHDGDEVLDSGNHWITDRMEAFYHKAQAEAFEAAAKLCDEQQLEPECPERAGYCAAAIREMAKEMK